MNETLRTIHSLRSIRSFSGKEIAKEDMTTILDAAVRAANSSGRQAYSIIVVEDEEILTDFYGANKALVFCVDFNRIMDTAKRMSHPIAETCMIDFVTGTTDTILAVQTAVIAAKSLGIDSLITNKFTGYNHDFDGEKLAKKLNLPDKYCFPLVTVCMGYPAEEPAYQKGRLKKGVIHHGQYKRLSPEELDTVIEEYDRPQHLALIDFKAAGFDHYLDWFYTKWLAPDSDKPSKIEKYENWLRKRRFLD